MRIPLVETLTHVEIPHPRVKLWPAYDFKDRKVHVTGDFVKCKEACDDGAYFIELDGKLYQIKSDGEIELKVEHSGAVGYLLADSKFLPIKKKGDKYILGNEKFTLYQNKYGLKVLSSKEKTLVSTPFTTIEVESGRDVAIFPTHVSILFDSYSVAIDPWGNEWVQKVPRHYVGETGIETIYYSPSGKVSVEGKHESIDPMSSITFCDALPVLVGTMHDRVAILCGDKVKMRSETGWISYDSEGGPLNVAYFDNVVLKLNDYTLVTKERDHEPSKIWVEGVGSVLWVQEGVFGVVKNYLSRIRLIECNDLIRVKRPVIDGRPAELEKDDCVKGFRVNVKDPLRLIRENGNKILVDSIDLKRNIRGIIQLTDEFTTVETPVSLSMNEAKISVIEASARRAIAGHLLEDRDFNALLVTKLSVHIPSTLPFDLSVSCCGAEKTIGGVRGAWEGTVTLKLRSYYGDSFRVNIVVLNERKVPQLTYELTVPVRDVSPPSKPPEVITKYFGASLAKIERVSDDTFEWDRLYLKPTDFDGVIFAKLGERVALNGNEVVADRVIETVDEENKNVMIVPIRNPVNSFRTEIRGHEILIEPICNGSEPFLIEAFYAGRVKRVFGCSALALPFDPFYNEMTVNVYYQGMRWKERFKLEGVNVGLGYQLAARLTNALSSHLSKIFGVP